jgi:Kdo2-lipid IVA lauroyltransferase/acyltransferase
MTRTATAPPFRRELLYPQHWPTWIGLGIFRALALLPLSWQLALGRGIGWLAGQLLRSRRHIVRVNLRLCFPDLPEAERERLVNAHFRSLGSGLFELAFAIFASDARFRPHGEVVGLEHLDAARAGGSGIVLLTWHFTTQEIGGRVIATVAQRPLHAMYRPIKNPVIDYCLHRWRENRSGAPALPRDDLRAIVRALRKGGMVWYAPDQARDEKVSVMAPFYGIPVPTVGATPRLAQMGRARVVPYFPMRVNGRYRATFLPALDNFPSGDDAADTARINRLLEDCIRQCPEQYFWVHRRFKRLRSLGKDVYT